MTRAVALLLAALLAGCGSDDDERALVQSVPAGVSSKDADTRIVVMGNSHAALNDIQGMIAAMVHAPAVDESVAIVEAPGWMFLEDRLYHAPSIQLLQSQDWSFVVLQAQKYSTSHTIEYSIEEAVELVQLAREQNAVPILFPEWPLRGVDETMYIYDIHVSIAQRAPACVAPVGQAWDLALSRHPGITLYADDGNHSSASGAFLAALILSATMTGASPLDLPDLAFPVAPETQALLRQVAADTIADWPPREHCPDDPY